MPETSHLLGVKQVARDTVGAPTQWTTAELAAVYTAHARALTTRAMRYVQDRQTAEDIVQEAFIKLILAAPELNDSEHLLAYLQKTVTNLAFNIRRDSGRKPLIIAADLDHSELESFLPDHHDPFAEDLNRADDAAIVREAISRLTEADRMIILAVDVAERSISALASEYGMKEASIHNAISRARRNLRIILEQWVLDDVSGLTAAQLLSRTYRKAAEKSKKVSLTALGFLLVVSLFVGEQKHSAEAPSLPKSTTAISAPDPKPNLQIVPVIPSVTQKTSSALATEHTPPLQGWALDYLSKVGPLDWPGIDADGLPVGFTVNDGSGFSGLALVSQDPFTIDSRSGRITATSRFTTFQDGLNVIVAQTISNSLGRITYRPYPVVRVGGSWVTLEIASISTDVRPLDDGTYLITSWLIVDLEATERNAPIAGPGLGVDAGHIPAVIATRLQTTATGAPILGQAVQILDPLSSQT